MAMITMKLAPMPELSFPPGTPVCVTEVTWRRDRSVEVRTVGVVDAWEELPTGSWYAHGKDDRLWLQRLRLRKVDGEITLMVIDDLTTIARLETVKK